MREIADGILQLTFPMPLGLDHVHCYLLRRPSGGWLLVDTGLGTTDWEERWANVVESLDAPIERILITHYHPDHVGGAGDAQLATGAEVLQGAHDHAMMLDIWANDDYTRRAYDLFRAHGVPESVAGEIFANIEGLRPLIRYVRDVTPLEAGDLVDGWEVLRFGGHADGHIALLRGDILVGGDNLLMEITPNIGFSVGGDPDPLGTYFATLARIEALAPRLVLPGHGPVVEDSVARCRETVAHHDERLRRTVAALDRAEPRSGYQVSLTLWDYELAAIHRRFAVQEAVAHLERLVLDGRARRSSADSGVVTYTPV